ncbi:MAG: Phosphomannomutase/phosphoglucomutase [Deltaproteobacteria bacterium ADurb.Bin510]|nr:MAG: Phosphomannomutase/phosphoglucomutase [Deltaproteobacteria bacterium ADurb.Bin510]
MPTPLLYYALFKLDLDGGVEITGSHNPADNNGFKIALGKTTIYGGEILKLRELVEQGARVTGAGSAEDYDIIPEYIEEVVGRIQMGSRRLKVVIDPGNGAGGLTALPVFERLGVAVTGICLEPDGRFPHHHPDPTVAEGIEMLQAEVAARGADLGIGFDGDADRIGVVDRHGNAIYGDMLTAILAGEILSRRPGEKIVGEVKCSKIFYDEVERLGGVAIMSKVGHSLMKARLHAEHAALAGEMSGHIFFSDRWFGFDDAIYAAARLLEILSREAEPQAIFDRLPKLCNTPEIRFDCPDAIKFAAVERFADYAKNHYTGCVDIDGVRFDDGPAWGLVRPSNTQPVIVMRFEAPDSGHLARLEAQTRERLDAIIAELN